MQLVLIRHGQSEWNKENRFTGWEDVELSAQGVKEARNAGRILREAGYDFDVCYTSYLKRAIHTLDYVLDEMDRVWLPVIKTWKLNERHYGALQGLNKAETAAKYGGEQVHIWRRSYDVKPPLLTRDDPRNPELQEQYRSVQEALPLGENLKDTEARVIAYYEEHILKDMKAGKRVIIVAHGNTIRALVKYFEHLSEEEITRVDIPTGVPLVYEFTRNGNFLDERYLGSPDAD